MRITMPALRIESDLFECCDNQFFAFLWRAADIVDFEPFAVVLPGTP